MGRRCFSDKIVESDDFKKLSVTAQALYFHLGMSADDDGFLNNAESISAFLKGGMAALRELVTKRFLLKFGSVYVVKHWLISNSIKNDRVKPLNYANIAAGIWVKPNRAYTDHPVPGTKTLYERKTGRPIIPNGIHLESKTEENGIHLESVWNPNLTQPNLTQPNLTQPNLTQPNPLEDFERLWQAYPAERRGNKDSSREAYRLCVTSPEEARENLELWKKSEQWAKEGGRFVPYLSNWLMRDCWKTKPVSMAIPKGASGQLGEAELEAIRRVLETPVDDFDQ